MHQKVVNINKKKRKKNWKIWTIGIALVIILIAILMPKSDKALSVTIEKAGKRDIMEVVSATGKVRPKDEIKIAPEVAGEIIELPVVDGQKIKKGDLLMKIRPDPYVAAVKQAQATVDAAEAACRLIHAQLINDQLDLKRNAELFKLRANSDQTYRTANTKAQASKASYEQALHQIEVAKGQLANQQTFLDRCVIHSPDNGTVTLLNSALGERVVATGQFQGTEVMRIADLSQMEVRVDINENDIVNVAIGSRVKIKVDAYLEQPLEGVVRQMATTATVKGAGTQQEVTTFEVRIAIKNVAKNSSIKLSPGMSANVEIEGKSIHDVVSVPIQSVTVRNRKDAKTLTEMKEEKEKENIDDSEVNKKELERVVFIKQGNKAKMRRVELGLTGEDYVQIVSGLQVGDEVVTGPYSVLSNTMKDGSELKVIKNVNEKK